MGQVGDEIVRNWRAAVFAVLVTAGVLGTGVLIGYWLGVWGALLSFAMGALEGGLLFRWLLRKRRRALAQK
jgi:hypothetical protein